MYDYDIIIIGAGPAGIFTALELFKISPQKKVLIIDSGRSIEHRKCPARQTGKCVKCNPCNIINGWSGAGAFSDGKLSLSEAVGGNITNYISTDEANDIIYYADSIYLEFGAQDKVFGRENTFAKQISVAAQKENIELIPCPVRHMGTEHAFTVLKNMYEKLKLNKNFEFLECTTAKSLLIGNNKIEGIIAVTKNGDEKVFKAPYVVAAPGRGGSAWLNTVASENNISIFNNEVDIGVRVEVPNTVMEHLTNNLYEAKLVYYSDTFKSKVRTFCMNPGGIVSEEHYKDGLAVVNGHSYADKSMLTKNTNFAMLVSTKFTSPFNCPLDYGKYIAKLGNILSGGGIMVQRLGDLLNGQRTTVDRLAICSTVPTLKNATPGDLSLVLPQRHLTSIVESIRAFDKLAPGLYSPDTLLYGVEVKFYSSKIDTNNSFETSVKNFYTIGDGAGITRGLMQASVTGIIVARDILSKF